MAKKKKSSKRQLVNNIFSMDPFQIIQQQGTMNGDGYNEDMMYFKHPILGLAPEMLNQAFLYEKEEHQNHHSLSHISKWHEEKDHFELVVTCPGLSKKRAKVSFDECCLVVKCKLKPLSRMMVESTFHTRVPLPEGCKNIKELNLHITDLDVERAEFDGSEGICIMIRKPESETPTPESILEQSEEPIIKSSKKSKKKKSKPKKKAFNDEFDIIDAQFIEKCA